VGGGQCSKKTLPHCRGGVGVGGSSAVMFSYCTA
jgi:hypothetical protein